MNLIDLMTPECRSIVADKENWSQEYMMQSCALCKKPFHEEEIPLHLKIQESLQSDRSKLSFVSLEIPVGLLWTQNGHASISFHVECAFGDKAL